jgi:two-component system, OmpR family, sensor histidine kinase KdpD
MRTGYANHDRSGPALRYGIAATACAAVVVVATPLRGPLDLASIVMLFLVAVFATALWLGRGPSVMASVLSVALFDFFFVPPRFTFAVAEASSLVTFAVMLAVALITAELTSRALREAALAAERAREAHRLYEVARQLAGATSVDGVRAALDAYLEPIACRSVVCLSDPDGEIAPLRADPAAITLAHTAMRSGEPVELSGLGEPDGPQALVPLLGPARSLGVLALVTRPGHRVELAAERDRLLTLAGLAALALERLSGALPAA